MEDGLRNYKELFWCRDGENEQLRRELEIHLEYWVKETKPRARETTRNLMKRC